MPQPASAVFALPAPALPAAIDRYLAGCATQLDRTIAAAALGEPSHRDPDRAARLLEPLLETLAGLALGQVIGLAAAGVRRTFGAAVHARVEVAIAHALGAVAPPAPPLFALDAAPCRSFATELGHRLRRRVALVPREAGAALHAIATALGDDDPQLAVLGRLLGVLTEDPLLADRYAAQLATGWRTYVALVEGTPRARTAPSAPIWDRWARQLTGERAPIMASQAEVVAAGFIVRIG